jgi:hypothetical protein
MSRHPSDTLAELRMLAAGMKDETTRQMLSKLADDYNHMADIHDQLAALKL